MRTGWRSKPRKERLEEIAYQGDSLGRREAATAWKELMVTLAGMSFCEAPNVRFDGLLLAIVRAHMAAKRKPR